MNEVSFVGCVSVWVCLYEGLHTCCRPSEGFGDWSLWLQSSHSLRIMAVLWVPPEQRGDQLQSPAVMGSSSTYRPVQSASAGCGHLLADPPETTAGRGPPASGLPSWIHSARSSEIKTWRLGEQGAEGDVSAVHWICLSEVWVTVSDLEGVLHEGQSAISLNSTRIFPSSTINGFLTEVRKTERRLKMW